MEFAVKLARIGNFILSLVAVIMIVLMMAYGGYSLWDNYMLNSGAFLSNDLLKYKPPENSGTEDNLTLEELMAVNPETRAWITIDGTHVDYPVVQGEDDMKYVNTDVFGEFALSGAIFLSYRNSPDFSDHYNMVYGHHMDNGGMFGDVVEFIHEDYFEAHKTGTLYLPHKTYKISLFACMEADAYDHLVYSHGKSCDVQAILDYLNVSSTQYRDIGVTAEDQIIAMSTCVDAATNGRIILFGRLDENTQEGGGEK